MIHKVNLCLIIEFFCVDTKTINLIVHQQRHKWEGGNTGAQPPPALWISENYGFQAQTSKQKSDQSVSPSPPPL